MNAGVMTRKQNVRHGPAAPVRRPCVVRVFGRPVECLGEGFLEGGGLRAESAWKLAQDRVEDDHRRELAAGEHVAADRDLLGDEVLEDALVEALVAAAQERQL